MKYLLFPIHLLQFWYIEGLTTFFRTWKNLILFLEEDLAVGLMLKLLFVPLFPDSSIVSFILSLIFRVTRIFIGIFAFVIASAGLIAMAIIWFSLPMLALLNIGTIYSKLLLFSGVGLFLIHTLLRPHKKVWQVRTDNLWESSRIKKNKFSYHNLLEIAQVKLLLSYLETTQDGFVQLSVPDLDTLGAKAFELAKRTESDYIEPEHFFVAILELNPDIDNLLLKLNLHLEDFQDVLVFLQKRKSSWRRIWLWEEDFAIHHLRGTNRDWLGMPTPILDSVSKDLTRAAAKGAFDTFFGRTAILSKIIDVLSWQKGKNVILVGSAGSGKSTLIKFLAKQIVTGNVPNNLAAKRLVELDLTKADLTQKIKDAFDQIQDYQNIIVVIEEIHNMALEEIDTYLDFGNCQFIATTEPENYNTLLKKMPVLARVFTKIEIPPASVKESLDILENKAIEIERSNKLRVSFLALKKTVELSNQASILKQAVIKANNGWVNSKSVEDAMAEVLN